MLENNMGGCNSGVMGDRCLEPNPETEENRSTENPSEENLLHEFCNKLLCGNKLVSCLGNDSVFNHQQLLKGKFFQPRSRCSFSYIRNNTGNSKLFFLVIC